MDSLQLQSRNMNREYIYAKLLASKLLDEPLSVVHSNPFVSDYRWTQLEFWRVYTLGALVLLIRFPPFIILLASACLFAKVFVVTIAIVESFGFDPELIRLVGRWVCFFLLRAAFFVIGMYWIRYIDRRPDTNRLAPIVVAAPHTSFYDILVMMKLRNPTFVSKDENRDAPFFGNLFKLCQAIYVNRSDNNSRETTKNAIRERALEGENVLIFPEGTCHNRAGLLEFQLGAFFPGLPVTPVIVRWDAAGMDTITWTWDGPDPLRIFFHTLTRISTNMEMTILPTYMPSEQERQNAKLFASNVEKWMCAELGVWQWFFSFDDVPTFCNLRQMNQFTSPSCVLVLKLVEKLVASRKILAKLRVPTFSHERETSPIMATNHNERGMLKSVLSIGEDTNHTRMVAGNDDVMRYVPRDLKSLNSNDERQDKKKSIKSPPLVERSERLSASGTRRRYCKTWGELPPLEQPLKPEKRLLYEHYIYFIQHSIRKLENNFEVRAIESSEDLNRLLGLDRYSQTENVAVQLKLTPIIVMLLQVLEHSIEAGPPTTLHLLAVLHLNDLRESDPWQRVRVVMHLLQKARHLHWTCIDSTKGETVKQDAQNPKLILEDLRTLVWYVLGVQVFNDQLFAQQFFSFDYVRHNLERLFNRAMLENAPFLFELHNF